MSIEAAAATEVVRFSIRGVRYLVHLCGNGSREVMQSLLHRQSDTHSVPGECDYESFVSTICPETPYDLFCIYKDQMHPLSQDLSSIPYFFMPAEEPQQAFLLVEHSYLNHVNRILSTYPLPERGQVPSGLTRSGIVSDRCRSTADERTSPVKNFLSRKEADHERTR